jgi:hypothetical protein
MGRVCLASLALPQNEEKGLEFLVMHNQEEEYVIEIDVSYHVGVSKCSDAC